MRKGLQITLAILLISLGSILIWLVPRVQEPAYQGIALSTWLKRYDSAPAQADKAVRAIGTKGLPVLLQNLAATDSPTWLKVIRATQKQRLIRVNYTPAPTRRRWATMAFKSLGPRARDAVPALRRLYRQAPGEGPYGPGPVLVSLGPAAAQAIPDFLSNVASTNARVREIAVDALAHIHSRADLTVPVLACSLHDPEPEVRSKALLGLASFGEQAKPATPDLLSYLETEQHYPNRAGWALAQIHSDPDVVVPALLNFLRHTNPLVRARAAYTLGYFPTNSQSAVGRLEELLRDQDRYVRYQAANALKLIDPQAALRAGVK